MKKLVLFFAAAAMAVTASAQVTVEGSKFTDNWSIGIQGGLATKTTQNRWLSNTNPNAGLRLTKEITPVFGLVAEGIVYFNDRAQTLLMDRLGQIADYNLTARSREVRTNTFAKALNVNLLAKVNLSNLFGGYKGEPRTFEVSALYGFGWGKGFGPEAAMLFGSDGANELNSKAALNFAFNLGAAKAVQIFVEPSITFSGLKDFKYNVDRSTVQLNAGVVYKFKNSNGTHNFKLARLYDQDEIDRLNGIINDLRNRKPEVKEVIKEVVKEVPVGKEVRVDDLVFVTFAQGKSNLTADAKKALDGVKEGAHVQIVGTASPEGPAALNQKLSENRANVVAEYLKGRGVIVDEAVGKGVQGNTSNRLAIVYVK